jgi:dephospho-CoA kinase
MLDEDEKRALVFADRSSKERLEALLHPMIREEAGRRIAAATGPYVVLVVPLLVESAGYRNRVRRVLVVDCPQEIQIERVRLRSNLSADEVLAIVRSQVPREQRVAAADDVIDNSGSLAALQQQVTVLHARYLELARS